VGTRVYKGASGIVYGAVIDRGIAAGSRTVFVQLDLSNSGRSTPLSEYPGENLGVAVTETGGAAFSNLGGGLTFRYTEETVTPVEQGAGFFVSLSDGGTFLLSVDTDGSIIWIDPQTGKILAQFHLYKDEWVLEQDRLIRGRVQIGSLW
jgi:hypothetical protein